MNLKQKKRLITIISIITLLSIACGLILFALKQNINLFYTPTELKEASIKPHQTLRIGGYVKENSIHYSPSGESVDFIITDRSNNLKISYRGILPNLFREGQAVVVTGQLITTQQLTATQVLAKHDEKYVPKQLANELKKRTT